MARSSFSGKKYLIGKLYCRVTNAYTIFAELKAFENEKSKIVWCIFPDRWGGVLGLGHPVPLVKAGSLCMDIITNIRCSSDRRSYMVLSI